VDLRDYINVLRTRWKLVTFCTLLGIAAAVGASLLVTPQYQSSTKLFISAADAQSDVGQAYTGSLYTQQLVKSLLDVVTGADVTQAVSQDLNGSLTAEQVSKKLSASNPIDTSLIEITATDPDPVRAQQLAESAANHFTTIAVQWTQPNIAAQPIVQVNTVEAASLPTSPVTPRLKLNIALGLLVGLMIGIGAAVLLETLDTRIKTLDHLDRFSDIPVLAVIGFDSSAAKKPLITSLPRHSQRSESFRQLRTNLQFVDVDNPPHSIVVTSAIPGEGKSTTAVNLAISITQAGHQVFLIEGDLRRPKVAEYMGLVEGAGLTDVLVGRASVEQVLQPWGPGGNLWVLPAGTLPPNPAELVGSQAMADLIHDLERRAFVIIDAPPLLPVTDGAILTRMCGGALMVVGAGRTKRDQLRGAVESISNVGGHVLGIVFNRAPTKGPGAYRYGYGYSYGYTNKKKGHEPLPTAPVSPANPLSRKPVALPPAIPAAQPVTPSQPVAPPQATQPAPPPPLVTGTQDFQPSYFERVEPTRAQAIDVLPTQESANALTAPLASLPRLPDYRAEPNGSNGSSDT
jgi:polysaccharide biosynthesis transport protein